MRYVVGSGGYGGSGPLFHGCKYTAVKLAFDPLNGRSSGTHYIRSMIFLFIYLVEPIIMLIRLMVLFSCMLWLS